MKENRHASKIFHHARDIVRELVYDFIKGLQADIPSR
jgi:hypothetical protein